MAAKVYTESAHLGLQPLRPLYYLKQLRPQKVVGVVFSNQHPSSLVVLIDERMCLFYRTSFKAMHFGWALCVTEPQKQLTKRALKR